MKDKLEIIATLVEKWRKRLQLQDWEIQTSVIDAKQMKKEVDVLVDGCVKFEIYKKQAFVYILDKVEDIELESVIVHELLHVVLSELAWFYKRIINYVGDDAVQELLTTMKTDHVERLLHQITSALLRERC